jgi:hypothetical protein
VSFLLFGSTYDASSSRPSLCTASTRTILLFVTISGCKLYALFCVLLCPLVSCYCRTALDGTDKSRADAFCKIFIKFVAMMTNMLNKQLTRIENIWKK